MTGLEPQLVISSPQNNRVKSLLKLRERKVRQAMGVFGVEGSREISHALVAGFELKEFFYCPHKMSQAAREIVDEAGHQIGASTAIEVSDSVYERIAVRTSADGIIGVFKSLNRSLSSLNLPAFPLILAVDPEVFYKIHLWSRLGSSISLELESFQFRNFDDLSDRCSRLPWTRLFRPEHGYLIDGIAGDRGSGTLSSNQISKAVRMGIESAFARRKLPAPKVDLQEPKVKVVGFVRNGRIILSVNTSGKALHKRGYKEDNHPAPLKETLAATCLYLSGYNGTQTFLDPMCGSGTLAIEAAYIALNKAPMIHRKKGQFGFEWLLQFDKEIWRKSQDQARACRLPHPQERILASDLNPRFVRQAQTNALKARVEKDIEFEVWDFFDIDLEDIEPGIMIANLPYGDRIGAGSDLAAMYKKIGDTLKQSFKGWQVYLLTSLDAPYKSIGLKASSRIPLKNGSIECRLLKFEIFSGKYDDHRRETKLPSGAQPHIESQRQLSKH